jgi:hypothetical protein
MNATDKERPPPAARGLSVDVAERLAGDVLSELPWEGLPLDPDELSAAEFLESL